MKITLVDNGSSYLQLLEKLCQKFGDTKIYSYNQLHSDADAGLLVLSGGHHYAVLSHPSEYDNELALIQNFHGPVIGICLGHELIAYAHNATLERLDHKTKGNRSIRIVTPDPIFEGQTSFKVYESHRWVVKAAPEFTTLAESLDGIEILRHSTLPIYSFQFHPEQTISPDGLALFSRTINQLMA